jgi:translation initiation factor 1
VADDNTRLAYSTGGPVPESKAAPKPERRRSAAPSRDSGKGGIRIRLDRRASDRVVTVVSGLPGRPAELAELAKALKSACGAGGTVKDGALELQGDHRDKVEAALSARGLESKRAGG